MGVCGGVSGIGRATVERFVSDGARVAIFDVNANFEPFDDVTAKSIYFFQTDCSNKAQCLQNAKKVADRFGKINHLVYSGIILSIKFRKQL